MVDLKLNDSLSIYLVAAQPMIDFITDCIDVYPRLKLMDICVFGHKAEIPGEGNIVVVLEYNIENQKQSEDYLEFYKKEQIPVIVICNNIAKGFELLNKGATDILPLNGSYDSESSKNNFLHNLHLKVRTILINKNVPGRSLKQNLDSNINKIIAIGSSTGGTEAVLAILKNLPSNSPPILVVQHMPPVFTRLYAERLNKICDVSVWEAQDEDKLLNGLVLIAPGDKHMAVFRKGSDFYVKCYSGEKINGHCPSVDVLFNSLTQTAPQITVAVILTGMGADGAKGITTLRKHGAFTIGQDEKSSIVYGMPRVAFELGGIDVQEDLKNIADIIIRHV